MSRSGFRKTVIVAAIVVAAAVAVRALLPFAVEWYANERLAQMGDYKGQVDDVDLALIRGAYTLDDLVVVKQNGSPDQPFLVLPRMDISVKWSALFEGKLVGEIQMQEPALNLVQGETDEETQIGTGVNWTRQVQKLFPFRFNRIEVQQGTATFSAPGIKSEESLTLHQLNAVLSNLTNMENRKDPRYAEFNVKGVFGEDAPLAVSGHVNPLAEQPAFDVNLSLEGAPLVDVNPWLEKFLNVDAEQGRFSMYAELAASDGRFKGYIKPLLKNAEIFRLEESADNPLQKAWEAIVDLVSEILKNPKKDQVATKIPFSGELDDPDAGLLTAVVNLLRNAFVAAFTHSVEGTVSMEEVEGEKS